MPNGNIATQLRREAAKARGFADHSFNESERMRLEEVAVSLDREAMAIEIAQTACLFGQDGPERRRPALAIVRPHPEA